jgi:Ca2+-binding RTX toxin-like protein
LDGNDSIDGGKGSDRILSGSGINTIIDGAGDDIFLAANAGNDLFSGDTGKGRCTVRI